MTVMFDAENRQLLNKDESIPLSRTLADCLQLMLEHAERPVTKEEIVQRCWTDKGVVVSDSSLRVMLFQLRKALEAAGAPSDSLITLHGQGYQLRPDCVALSPVAGEEAQQPAPSPSAKPKPDTTASPTRRRRFGREQLYWLLAIIVSLSITSALIVLRLSGLVTPLQYVQQSSQLPGVTLFMQRGMTPSDTPVDTRIAGLIDKHYLPAQSHYWVYVNASLHGNTLNAIICDKPIDEKSRQCYVLDYAFQR